MFIRAFLILFRFRSYQLIAFSVNVDNLNRIVFLQMFTQFGDINIHTTCIEVIIINPDSLQGKVTLKNLVCMSTQQTQQLRFFGCQLGLLITY